MIEYSEVYPKRILAVTTLASFLTAFISSAINIALPAISNDFDLSSIMLTWVSTSYLLTTVVLLIPIGKLADLVSRKLFFKIGTAVFTVGTFFCSISNSDVILLISRIIQGLGAAFIFCTAIPILISAYDKSQRGRVIGINTASVYVGLATGPVVSGIVVDNLGWRYIFVFNYIIGFLVTLFAAKTLRHTPQRSFKITDFDFGGTLIYIGMFITLFIGFSFIPQITGFIFITISIIAFLIFLIVEKKVKIPIFDFTIFRNNRVFLFSNIAAFINYSSTFAIGFLMSLYLQNIKHISAKDTGLLLIAQPVFMAIFSPLAGKLSDKKEPQIIASFGMGIITICLGFLVFVDFFFSKMIIVIVISILGFGYALFSSPNSNAIMSSVKSSLYSTAASTLSSMRMIGQSFSMGIVTIVFSIMFGSIKFAAIDIPILLSSIRLVLIIFVILCFAGIFSSLARGSIHS
ncbi:MAG: MFS transporter [Ignavibacteria bacterium]